jgi:hypothetical protein
MRLFAAISASPPAAPEAEGINQGERQIGAPRLNRAENFIKVAELQVISDQMDKFTFTLAHINHTEIKAKLLICQVFNMN